MPVSVENAKAAYQGYPPSDPSIVRTRLLEVPDLEVRPYHVHRGAFQTYLEKAPYPESYKANFGDFFLEKALEHFISIDLSPLRRSDVFIDIASSSSPFSEIVEDLWGIPNYRQDLAFEDGVYGRTVGGSSESLPFPNATFTRMTLHCSLEHFERDADSNFISEAERVLKPGGTLCVVPLYLSEIYHNLTDPGTDRNGLLFDDGAAVAEVPGWNNRFGRNYDVGAFATRVLGRAQNFRKMVYFVENEKEIAPNCYVKFALLLRKKRPSGLLGLLGG